MLSIRDNLVAQVWFLASHMKSSNNLFLKISLVPFFFKILHYSIGLITCNDLSINVKMKSRVKIYHAIGVIVGSGAEFGHGVVLRARATVGESQKGDCSAPRIGDNVEFGVGAMVFGDVSVPNGTLIKAGEIYRC